MDALEFPDGPTVLLTLRQQVPLDRSGLRSRGAFKMDDNSSALAGLFIILVVSAICIVPFFRIFRRTGRSGWWSLRQHRSPLDYCFWKMASPRRSARTRADRPLNTSTPARGQHRMADEISITKVHGCEEVSKPTTHLLVRVDTENGPLVLKVSINAARELMANLARLPPNLGFQSPSAKQS
jgi:hypothetical protein